MVKFMKDFDMVRLSTKSSEVNELLFGVYDYINRVDPYAYRSSKIDYTGMLINKDCLSVQDAYYMACCAGIGHTKYVDGTIINVVDNGHSYIVYYAPARSKYDALRKFEDNYREADPVLMDAIVNYFMSLDGTHLYTYKKYGRIHYGVLQDDDGVYEGTIEL